METERGSGEITNGVKVGADAGEIGGSVTGKPDAPKVTGEIDYNKFTADELRRLATAEIKKKEAGSEEELTKKALESKGTSEAKDGVQVGTETKTKQGKEGGTSNPPEAVAKPATESAGAVAPQVNIEELRTRVKEDILRELEEEAKQVEAEKSKEPPKPKFTEEQLKELWEKDPAKFVTNQFEALREQLKGELRNEIKADVDKDLAPKTKFVQQRMDASALGEAVTEFAELKDPKFTSGEFAQFMKKNTPAIYAREQGGENPFKVGMEMYLADKNKGDIKIVHELKKKYNVKSVDDLVKLIKQEGTKEGEQKVENAKKAFAESGGKPQVAETKIDPDKMTAKDLKNLITSIKK